MRLVLFAIAACALSSPAVAQSSTGQPIGSTSYTPNLNLMPAATLVRARYNPARVETARNLVAQEKYREALAELGSPFVHPQSRDAQLLKGVAWLEVGDAQAARRFFRDAAKASRHRDVAAMTGLALAEIKLGDVDAAKSVLHKLQRRQATCGGTCDSAASLDAAVGGLEKVIG